MSRIKSILPRCAHPKQLGNYQDAKQESFWANVEGGLTEMLDGYADVTLDFLNEVTEAWVEIEYNRAVHRETSNSPVERFAKAPDVLHRSPSSEALRSAVG